eukprot:augustus_masked-scaffold_66-processed-gene-0.86-mRNA-1 protein AED:1.00 eAED:1.00 QI:0/0/0/0/1/1/4/0/405
MEKVTCSHESSVLERLNIYMISASKCIKWNQLKESARKFEVLKALNKRLPIQLQIRETRLKMKLNAPRSRFGNFLDKFKDLIRPIYEGKMDTAERVHLTPLDPVNVAPSESEFRRVYQETRRGGKKKRKHYISSDESERGRSSKSYRRGSRSSSPRGYRGRSSHGRYTPQNNQSCYRHRNKRCKKSNHRQPKPCNSFLAPTAPGDEYERSKRNPTRRLDIAAQMRAPQLYDMIVVEVNLTLILDKNFNLTKRGYAFAETVKILDKGAGGNLTIISYFVFTKDLDLQKLRCHKSKDVQFLTGLKLSRLYLAAIARKLAGGKKEVLNNFPAIRTVSIDFSLRLRDGNAESIALDKTIHLKQNKNVVDEDNLKQLTPPEGNALHKPEREKAEIREAIVKMMEAAGDAN